LDFNDLAAGSLVFEFDGISSDSDDSGAGGIGRLARDDLQAHLGTLGAADQLDHVIQAHADHVGDVLAFLANTNDAVSRLEGTSLVRWTTRYQASDLDVFAIGLEQRTDAFQGQAHLDIE